MAVGRRLVTRLWGRQLAIVAVGALWVAVIVIAAGQQADADSWIGVPSLDWLAYLFVACMAIGAAVIVAMTIVAPKKPKPQAERKPMWPLLLMLLVFVLLSQWLPQSENEAAEPAPAVTVPEAEQDAQPIIPADSSIDQTDVTIVLILAVAALLVLVFSRRRDEGDIEAEAPTMEQALSPAVERATNQLRLGDDPRSAVLVAYDSLESALTEMDCARTPSETPTEHLTRVLASLQINTEPLLGLANLYQLARFSDHRITAADQQQAIEWLQQSQHELEARA